MPSTLVKITKEYAGEEWENVWCFQHGADRDPGFTEADWLAVTGSNPSFTSENTDSGDPGYAGATSLLHALIGFERLVHYPAVNFVRLFAWDGIENIGPGSTFISVPLGFNGTKLQPGSVNEIAPGNVAWMIAKQSAAFGARSGRVSFRMALYDSDIRAGGKRLLDWTDDTTRATYVTLLQDSVEASLLDQYMAAVEVGTNPYLAIPKYVANTGTDADGNLLTSTLLASLVSKRPVSRQVSRGRKRPAA